MRLVRYEDPFDGTVVEPHPLLTVVSGLSPAARARLIDAIAAIPRGVDPGANGSIEVYGVFLDLSRESLELLELHEDLDTVIRAGDLPGSTTETTEAGRGTDTDGLAEGWNATVPHDGLRGVAEVDDELVTAVRVAEQEVETITEQLADLNSRRDGLRPDLAARRAALDPSAPVDLATAVEQLEVLERRRDEALGAKTAAVRAEIEARLEELIARVDSLRREIKRLRAIDAVEVRDRLVELEQALDPAMIPSAGAQELADELEAVDDRLALLQSQAAGGRSQLLELTARRDAAYEALVAAEASLHSPDLDPSVVEELESVHDEIFELDGRVAKLSSARLRRRMGELRDREDELLGRLGFDSWSSYVMGVSSTDADTERARRHDVAKATYEFAEDEVAKAAGSPAIESAELLEVETRRSELRGRAESLLGRRSPEAPGDQDLVSALRDLRVPATTADPVEVAARLLAALSAAGAQLPVAGASASPRETGAAASAWLEEISGVPARLAGLETERQRLELEITRQAERLDALSAAVEAERAAALSIADTELVAARELVARAQLRLDRHRSALDALERLDAQDRALTSELESLASILARRTEELAGANAAVAAARSADARRSEEGAGRGRLDDMAASPRLAPLADMSRASRIDGVEWYVLARLAQQRSVSFVGSVPLVLDDTFAEWPHADVLGIYERLVRMSDVVQIMFVTDSVEVIGWARSLGRDRALALDLSPTSTPT